MNMQEEKKPKKIKLRFWHYFTLTMFVAMFAAAMFSIFTPKIKKVAIKNEAIITNYDKSKTTFKKITFSGQEIILPETFGVFKATPSNSSAEILANQIISKNQMVSHQSIPNYWTSETTELAKSDYENSYTFIEKDTEQESDLKIIKDEAIKTCSNFYSKYNVDLKLVPQKNSVTYIGKGSGFEQNKVEEKDAYYAQIPLTYEVNGYPVFYENSKEYPFFCKVDNNYNLERVVFKNFFYNFDLTEQLAPITIEQAVNNIKNGTASIINAESQIAYIIDLNWIDEADLYSVEIDYRYDSVLKIVYPFYKFKARLTNSSGINIQAEIITPAIATAKDK